jgi:hypothetical protein
MQNDETTPKYVRYVENILQEMKTTPKYVRYVENILQEMKTTPNSSSDIKGNALFASFCFKK